MDPHNGHTDDYRILEDFRQGRIAPLYRKVYPSLIIFANQYLGQDDSCYAEDFVQNAIFNAWKTRNTFPSLNSLKSFLYTSIRNEAISYLRKNKARARYLTWIESLGECFDEQLMMEADITSHLLNAIAEMPETEKRVLELSFLEGKKNLEIARIFNVSDRTIKKYKARALYLLRNSLNGKHG